VEIIDIESRSGLADSPPHPFSETQQQKKQKGKTETFVTNI
jgi:hypothetical protein